MIFLSSVFVKSSAFKNAFLKRNVVIHGAAHRRCRWGWMPNTAATHVIGHIIAATRGTFTVISAAKQGQLASITRKNNLSRVAVLAVLILPFAERTWPSR